MRPDVLVEGEGYEPPDPNEPCVVTSNLSALVESGCRFACVYADPPWRYDKQAGRGAVGERYQTMTVGDIAALPVGELAADASHLWLWTTNAFLFESFRLFEAWGFQFVDSLAWCKPQMGVGNYIRNSHELLLLGVRGELAFPPGVAVRSYVVSDRTEHSAKPEAVRRIIEQVSPGPRLELFGRKLRPGWTVFGDQIDRSAGLFDSETVEL